MLYYLTSYISKDYDDNAVVILNLNWEKKDQYEGSKKACKVTLELKHKVLLA